MSAFSDSPKSGNVGVLTVLCPFSLPREQTALHTASSPLPFLQALAQHDSLPTLLASPQDLLNSSRSLLSDFLPEESVQLWDLGLAARETAPRVEALLKVHDELDATGMDECGAWVQWKGRRGCGKSGLEDVLSASVGDEQVLSHRSVLSSESASRQGADGLSLLISVLGRTPSTTSLRRTNQCRI